MPDNSSVIEHIKAISEQFLALGNSPAGGWLAPFQRNTIGSGRPCISGPFSNNEFLSLFNDAKSALGCKDVDTLVSLIFDTCPEFVKTTVNACEVAKAGVGRDEVLRCQSISNPAKASACALQRWIAKQVVQSKRTLDGGTGSDDRPQIEVTVAPDGSTVTVNGVTERLQGGDDGEFIELLIKNPGTAIKAGTLERALGSRPDRIYRRLPRTIKKHIWQPGRGGAGYIFRP